MPTSALLPIRDRADVGIGPYGVCYGVCPTNANLLLKNMIPPRRQSKACVGVFAWRIQMPESSLSKGSKLRFRIPCISAMATP